MLIELIRQYVTHPQCIYDVQPVTNFIFVLVGIASPHRRPPSTSSSVGELLIVDGCPQHIRNAFDPHLLHRQPQRQHHEEPRLHQLGRLLIMATQWISCLGTLLMTLHRNENFIAYFFESDVSKVTSLIELVLSLLAVLAVYLFSFCGRDRLRRLFGLLFVLDNRLNALTWTVVGSVDQAPPANGATAAKRPPSHLHPTIASRYRRTIAFSVCCVGASIVLLLLYVVASYAMQFNQAQLAHTYAWVAYFWPQLVLLMVMAQVICVMRQLACRFAHLNMVSVGMGIMFSSHAVLT